MSQHRLHYADLHEMPPPSPLPCITEPPKEAFLGGWWAGISVGFVIGVALAVLYFKG